MTLGGGGLTAARRASKQTLAYTQRTHAHPHPHTQVSGSSANDVAKQLKDQNMFIQGHRDTQASLKKELNRCGALLAFRSTHFFLGWGKGIFVCVGLGAGGRAGFW